MTYRNSHFGGRAVYDSIRTIADGEWDRNRVIRRRAGQSSDSTERRKALYRWLRLEYRRMGIDTEAEIVSMMRTGMTPTLQTSVGRLRAALPGLSVGGFVARPKKNNRVGYRLGTLSEHGTGKAIDVTPQRDNPQIPRRAWAEIQRIAGSTVNRSRARWLTNPGDMWQDTQNLNQAFIRNVNSRIEAVKATRREAGADPDTPNPLNEVITNPWLRNRCIDHGLSFFTLSRDLVMAMHGEGLIWGLTFRTTPDLHHFEEP